MEILTSMTLEQKAQLLVGAGNDGFAGSGAMMGTQKRLVAGAAGITVEMPDLGLPSIVLTDGPAGSRSGTKSSAMHRWPPCPCI